MKRGLRETIRRTPDHERDPDWDIFEVLDPKRKSSKVQGLKKPRMEEDDEILFEATKEE